MSEDNINLFFISCLVSRLGELHDVHEPNLTFEGDNNVILQQTANYLLGYLKDCLAGEKNRNTEREREKHVLFVKL